MVMDIVNILIALVGRLAMLILNNSFKTIVTALNLIEKLFKACFHQFVAVIAYFIVCIDASVII